MKRAIVNGWLVPAMSMLCAVTLSWAAGPSMRGFMRAMSDTTGSACKVKTVTILPIMTSVKVENFIDDITAPAGEKLTVKNAQVQKKSDSFEVFGLNPAVGKMIRVVAGLGYPGDDTAHNVVLVKITGISTPNTQESLYVESDDVDDPQETDPGKADYQQIEANQPALAANNIRQAIDYFLRGEKGPDNIGGLDNARPAPAGDWENLNADNRAADGPGGTWLNFSDLSSSEKTSLKTADPTNSRPPLAQHDFADWQGADCNKKAQPDAKSFEVVEGVQCKRIFVTHIPVNSQGEFTAWLLFRTSLSPGDNFRIMAHCAAGGTTPLDFTIPLQNDPLQIGRLRVKLRNKANAPPLPDPITGRTKRGVLRDEDIDHVAPQDVYSDLVISDMITVWRRLHLELDWMGGDPSPKKGAPDPLRPDEQSVTLIKPDASQFKQQFRTAYIEVEADVPAKDNKVPVIDFVHHMPPGTQTDKALYTYITSLHPRPNNVKRNNPRYWSNHLMAWYCAEPGVPSNEPPPAQGDVTGVFGGDTGQIGDGSTANAVTSVVFHETIRRTSVGVNNVTFAGNGAAVDKTVQRIIQRAYLHEAGHQFTDSKDHKDGGLMDPLRVWADPGNNPPTFAQRTIWTFRSTFNP